jgi:hypothetical protein
MVMMLKHSEQTKNALWAVSRALGVEQLGLNSEAPWNSSMTKVIRFYDLCHDFKLYQLLGIAKFKSSDYAIIAMSLATM